MKSRRRTNSVSRSGHHRIAEILAQGWTPRRYIDRREKALRARNLAVDVLSWLNAGLFDSRTAGGAS